MTTLQSHPRTALASVLPRLDCRVCGSRLHGVLTLGDLRLNAFPESLEALQAIPTARVTLCICAHCGLAQLDRTVPPDLLYRTYWYRSGVNELMRAELADVVADAVARAPIAAGDAVLDIGANDGTLLANYAALRPYVPHRVAVEPALNLHEHLVEHADQLLPGYFPADFLLAPSARFRIITAIACAYDLEDPVAFFRGIAQHLASNGVAIIQFQDLGQMIETNAFDNIVHEHLEYYTLHSLLKVVTEAGLQVVDCTRRAINGGSLRVVLRHGLYKVGVGVHQQMDREVRQGLSTLLLQTDRSALQRFRQNVLAVQTQIGAVLQQTFEQGVTVDVYGASTKGNILLQVMGVGPDRVRQAIDRSPEKVGRLTITGIPIVGEEEGRRDPAAVWLTNIWQFRAGVLERERWFLEEGRQMLFALPRPEIVYQQKEKA